MADEATDVQLLQHQLNQKMLEEFTSLAHKHATVSYALIAVLVVVLSAAGFGGYFGLKSYQAAIVHAEQVEKDSAAVISQYQQQLAADTAERVRLEQEIATRDKQTERKKKEVAQNTTDPIKAMSNLATAYGDEGSKVFADTPLEADGRWGFNIPAVNQFTQTKMDKDALAADVDDLQSEVESLKLDQEKGQQALAACQTTVNAYKKAAKKSKWQKVVSGMKIGGAIVLSAFIGHAI